MCKVRIILGESTWSAPLNKELPPDTYNNMSSSTISSRIIKIGQSLENKGDLKLKLHVYAMKRNFEFKVKKVRKKCLVYNLY